MPISRRGMTLVELIIVMALLAVVLALSAPKLSGFFHGRAITEESRRFLALTRYAREEAIGAGIPVRVWIDVEDRQYGAGPATGYEDASLADLRFELSDSLLLEVQGQVLSPAEPVELLFNPDGSLQEPEFSSITLRDENTEEKLYFIRAETGPWLLPASEEEVAAQPTPTPEALIR